MHNLQGKIQPTFNKVLGLFLLIAIIITIVKIANATTPNPGHNFTSASGGVATGDILYGSAADTLSALSAVETGNALISGGVETAPSWGKINLTTHVTETLPVGNGGTGTATAFTLGSVPFAGASGVYSQDNANFFWDDTNNRLGLGTATPNEQLEMTGNIRLPATTSTTGQIKMGTNPFAHAYGTRNTFIGSGTVTSGNLTLTGTDNVGIGNALTALTTGSYNIALGSDAAGSGLTTGSYNILMGRYSGQSLTTQTQNVILGYLSGSVYTGSKAVLIGSEIMQSASALDSIVGVGYGAINNLTTGAEATGIGPYAITNCTTGSWNTGV